jgi:septum formation topological specificity factor MinE
MAAALINLIHHRRKSASLAAARLRAQIGRDRLANFGEDITQRIQDACLREIRRLARGGQVRVRIGTSPHLEVREIEIDLTPGR